MVGSPHAIQQQGEFVPDVDRLACHHLPHSSLGVQSSHTTLVASQWGILCCSTHKSYPFASVVHGDRILINFADAYHPRKPGITSSSQQLLLNGINVIFGFVNFVCACGHVGSSCMMVFSCSPRSLNLGIHSFLYRTL